MNNKVENIGNHYTSKENQKSNDNVKDACSTSKNHVVWWYHASDYHFIMHYACLPKTQ